MNYLDCYVCERAETVEALSDREMVASTFADFLDRTDVSEFERIICIGSQAYTMADDLLQQQIDPMRLYVVPPEIVAREGLKSALQQPQDFNFRRIKPLSEARHKAAIQYVPTGIPSLQQSIRWRLGELCVIVGPYGSGKSSFAELLALDWVENVAQMFDTNRPGGATVARWEDDESDQLESAENHWECKFGGTQLPDGTLMKGAVLRAHIDELVSRIHYYDTDNQIERGIEDLLNDFAHRNEKFGDRFFLIDPWNRCDHAMKNGEAETSYTGRVLNLVGDFAKSTRSVVVIVTHLPNRFFDETGVCKPFRVGQGHGSANWGNKPDRGIGVMRTIGIDQAQPDAYHMVVNCEKLKREGDKRMGVRNTYALDFNPETSTIMLDHAATAEARKAWRY